LRLGFREKAGALRVRLSPAATAPGRGRSAHAGAWRLPDEWSAHLFDDVDGEFAPKLMAGHRRTKARVFHG